MDLRYERASTPRASYIVYLDDWAVAVVSKNASLRPTWTATTVRAPSLASRGETRHEATMFLLAKLAEHGYVR